VSTQEEQWEDDQKQPDQVLQQPEQQRRQKGRKPVEPESASMRAARRGEDRAAKEPPTARPSG